MSSYGRTQDLVVLVGAAEVYDCRKQTRETVYVLLDTGADRSFITEALADRLHLEDTGTVTLKISTFGSHEPMERTCGTANLQLWDSLGHAHWVSVARIDKLTDSLHRSTFTEEDIRFITEHDIKLSIEPYRRCVEPHILLGCSDVVSLLYGDSHTTWILPSGIKLIPSRLGYLVAGQLQGEVATNPTDTDAVAPDTQEGVQNWERFLALEGAGIQDFSGTKAKEQETVDRMVWESFKSTISPCENGYQ
ncbi:Peptidase A2 domain-containing protein, partial [Trichostrongylus colubriformis]